MALDHTRHILSRDICVYLDDIANCAGKKFENIIYDIIQTGLSTTK